MAHFTPIFLNKPKGSKSNYIYPTLYFICTYSGRLEFFCYDGKFRGKKKKAIAFPSLEAAKTFLFEAYGEETMIEIYEWKRESLSSTYIESLRLVFSN